ncbi:MAG: hypothetical protein DWP97_06415 [Calditrichaeota bacterium]|nr:MAG: hypothetical protein DWP97_06415 [Calditrichota bacterium]
MWASLLLLFLVTGGTQAEQKTDAFLFPSEDELFESYLLGEITYDEYIRLLDIVTNGVEEDMLTLTDELSLELLEKYFSPDDSLNQDKSEKHSLSSQQLKYKHSYASYLEENARSRYQSNFKYSQYNLSVDLTLRREFSGRERLIHRAVQIRDVSPAIHEIRIGNISKKFGLGTALGYHGKNVSFSDYLNFESLLYPDNGGYNGLYIDSRFDTYRCEILGSLVRDAEYAFSTFGAGLTKQFEQTDISFIPVVTSVKNRANQTTVTDYKSSFYLNYTPNRHRFKIETVVGKIKDNSELAIVTDNKIKRESDKIEFSGWYYSRSYIDLTGGSRTSLMSEKAEIDDVDYSFYTKRKNQMGMLTKYEREISDSWNVSQSVLYAFKSSDSTELQTFSQIQKSLNKKLSLYYDFSFRDKARFSMQEGSYFKRNHRFGIKLYTTNSYIRCYMSHEIKTGEDPVVGLFGEYKLNSQSFGLLHLWMNIGRYNLETKRTDYIYFFIRNKIDLTNWGKIDIKLSHRYGRKSTSTNSNQITMTFECAI